jgi:hypothetical protein
MVSARVSYRLGVFGIDALLLAGVNLVIDYMRGGWLRLTGLFSGLYPLCKMHAINLGILNSYYYYY